MTYILYIITMTSSQRDTHAADQHHYAHLILLPKFWQKAGQQQEEEAHAHIYMPPAACSLAV